MTFVSKTLTLFFNFRRNAKQIDGAGFYTHATMIGIFMDVILQKTGDSSSLRID